MSSRTFVPVGRSWLVRMESSVGIMSAELKGSDQNLAPFFMQCNFMMSRSFNAKKKSFIDSEEINQKRKYKFRENKLSTI